MFDIVILTDDRYVNPHVRNAYVDNVMHEDRLVINALEKKGLAVKKVSWSDSQFDWSTTQKALFRSTWDYAERFATFSDWLIQVANKTELINSYEMIVWNLDKHYLRDLAEKGISIVETYFMEIKDNRSLEMLHRELGWEETVLKPCVSAAGKDTFWLSQDNMPDHETHYNSLIQTKAMMLQPFQKSVTSRGEVSLMVFGGRYTHAVLKVAKQGDFRVQDDFGGTVHAYEPSKEEIQLALDAVHACESLPYYARVDIIDDNNGNPAISELELIEPELWFRRLPKAADILAEQL